MNSRELPANIALSQVNINMDVSYGDLVDAINGYELILQEGVLRHMGELLTVEEYAHQVCQLASLMAQVRGALLADPVGSGGAEI